MINVNSVNNTQKTFGDSILINEKSKKAITKYSSNVLFELFNAAKLEKSEEHKIDCLG